MVLTNEQENAIKKAKEWYLSDDKKPFVLLGCAGSGKSTIVSFIVDGLGLNPESEVKYVTFTGKAASVLIKKGNPATTIHKLIYIPMIGANGKIKGFEKRESLEDKNIKLIVADEFYMISDHIMKDLLSFNIKIICLGDNNQLPPPFGSVTELCNKPDAVLTKPLRQSLDNPIVYLAVKAMNHEYIKPGDYGNNVQVIRKTNLDLERLKNTDQIIVGKNDTAKKFNKFYRMNFKNIDRDNWMPQQGEKLICLKNNWNLSCSENNIETNLVNGLTLYLENDIDYIESLAYGIGNLRPDFYQDHNFKNIKLDLLYFMYNFNKDSDVDDEENIAKYQYGRILSKRELNFSTGNYLDSFTYGYAITTHKSQGSEWKDVFFIFEPFGNSRKDIYWQMLYTGITRASESLTVAI